jgi:hypothetical protein
MWSSKKGSPVWIQYDFDAAYRLHQMWVWNSNQSIESSVGFGAKDVQGMAVIQPNEWTHIAMTISKTAISVYMYGNKEASRAQTPLTNLILGGASIGGWANPGIQRAMPGRMDDVRIYDRALSDSEILGLANNL